RSIAAPGGQGVGREVDPNPAPAGILAAQGEEAGRVDISALWPLDAVTERAVQHRFQRADRDVLRAGLRRPGERTVLEELVSRAIDRELLGDRQPQVLGVVAGFIGVQKGVGDAVAGFLEEAGAFASALDRLERGMPMGVAEAFGVAAANWLSAHGIRLGIAIVLGGYLKASVLEPLDPVVADLDRRGDGEAGTVWAAVQEPGIQEGAGHDLAGFLKVDDLS